MTSNPPRSRAQRGAQGKFFLPGARPHEQQIRHVRAGNQQNESHGPQQQPQRATHVTANNLFIHAHQISGAVPVVLRILLLQTLGDVRQLGLRLRRSVTPCFKRPIAIRTCAPRSSRFCPSPAMVVRSSGCFTASGNSKAGGRMPMTVNDLPFKESC